MNCYYTAAHGYVIYENLDKSLEMLEGYTEIATSNIYPLKLTGDNFFNLIDGWLEGLPLGGEMPRDEKSIKQSMADVVTMNPAFSVFADELRFQRIVRRLKDNV